MINRDFRPGAPIRNFVKDLDTVLATAKQIGLPQLPIVKAVRDVFKELYDQGHERWDHSAFLLYLEKLNAPARLATRPTRRPSEPPSLASTLLACEAVDQDRVQAAYPSRPPGWRSI